MVRNEERVDAVKRLRSVARACEVPQCNDNACKARVLEMADAVLAAEELSEEQATEAEQALEAYKATWPDAQRDQPSAEAEPNEKPKEWYFQAVQLTYNKTEGAWASAQVTVLESLFGELRSFTESLAEKLAALGASVTLEESLKSGKRHVHAHVYLHLDKVYHRRGRDALDIFVFQGIKPHVVPNKATGKSYMGAVRYGHFYVFVRKRGSLFEWSNYKPFEDYGVEGWWLDNLMKAGKLTHDEYLNLAAKVVVGFTRRLADVQAVVRFQREVDANSLVAAEAAELSSSLYPLREYPIVEHFIGLFERATRFQRRPMLAIIGGTNLGKSILAADILRRIAAMLGLPSFLEVTVEDNPHLDFSDFNVATHGGVLLDGVADPYILWKNREALQGRPKLCKGAQSATMMYSYKYALCRRAVVATFDLAAENLDALQHDHWLGDNRNILKLRLHDKVFIEEICREVLRCTKIFGVLGEGLIPFFAVCWYSL